MEITDNDGRRCDKWFTTHFARVELSNIFLDSVWQKEKKKKKRAGETNAENVLRERANLINLYSTEI